MRLEDEIRNKYKRIMLDTFGVPVTIMNVKGQRGEVDTVTWFPRRPALIEWKQPGQVPRKNQVHKHNRYKKLGYECLVFDNLEAALQHAEGRLRC